MNRIFWVDPQKWNVRKSFVSLLDLAVTPLTSHITYSAMWLFPQDVIASVLRGQYSPLSRPMEPGRVGWRWAKWVILDFPYINGWIYRKWVFLLFFFCHPYVGALLSNMVFGHTLLGCCFFFSFMGKSKVYVGTFQKGIASKKGSTWHLSAVGKLYIFF